MCYNPATGFEACGGSFCTMRVVDLLSKKREGDVHTDEEINFLIQNYAQGAVPDYQMSAWLMAVLWRGLTEDETFALTGAMVASGERLDLSGIPGTPVDKHSTGGVGDKTTLAVVPILASAGVLVAKMSGRGLGHTGGTLDKLESIPGTRTLLTIPEILAQVAAVGACLCAQTEHLVPADQKMYALRDATSTVQSLPLIAASIMSKKIAAGARAIVLDVKVGSGAFMKTLSEARALADLMIKIGLAHDRRVVAVLSDMDSPLGYSVGNHVEVREIVALLRGNPGTEHRLKALVRRLCAVGFLLAGRTATLEDGEALADRQIESGAAFDKLREIVRAQGGDDECLVHAAMPRAARIKRDVKAEHGGVIARIDASMIGLAAMRLGAGRADKDAHVDPTAGVVLRETVGATVMPGAVIATLHTNNEVQARQAAPLVADAFAFSDSPAPPTSLIYETLGLDS